MTPDDLRAEFDYRYAERVGILTQGNEPTVEEKIAAFDEADKATKDLNHE